VIVATKPLVRKRGAARGIEIRGGENGV